MEYQDRTGMMGVSYSQDEGPRMCFNNAKNWQLGWYTDRQEVVMPIAAAWNGLLVGVADYGSSAVSDKVVVKVEGHSKDYYVGFNRKVGINSGTQEKGNLVTIQSRTGTGFGRSALEAGLSAGQEFEIPNFGGGSLSVKIKVNAIVNGKADVTIFEEFCSSNAQCNDGVACTTDTCNIGTGKCSFSAQSCPDDNIVVDILTDGYPQETAWTIVDDCNDGALILSGSGYTTQNTLFTESTTVPFSKYTFTITDSFGDGICCAYGPGNYHRFFVFDLFLRKLFPSLNLFISHNQTAPSLQQ